LREKPITTGLGLAPLQIKELRSRLVSYWGDGGIARLDGIGLTPAQTAEIKRRIKAQVDEMFRHPLGWPCKPFKNPSLVFAFVRQELLENGFRSKPMTFTKATSRQLRFEGIQDGYRMFGVIAKTGPREIEIKLSSTDGWMDHYTFKLGFEA
jgi:hypothetical protein